MCAREWNQRTLPTSYSPNYHLEVIRGFHTLLLVISVIFAFLVRPVTGSAGALESVEPHALLSAPAEPDGAPETPDLRPEEALEEEVEDGEEAGGEKLHTPRVLFLAEYAPRVSPYGAARETSTIPNCDLANGDHSPRGPPGHLCPPSRVSS